MNDDRYALIECKLGGKKINEGAKNLLKINKLIEKNKKLKNPVFLAVLTAGEIAYTRPDGVKVIPDRMSKTVTKLLLVNVIQSCCLIK